MTALLSTRGSERPVNDVAVECERDAKAAPGKLAIPQWFEKTEEQIPCPAGEF